MVDFWCHVSVPTCHPSKIAEMTPPSAGLPKDHPSWTRQKLQDCRWFLGARISSSIPSFAKVNHPKKTGGWWKGGWKFHPFLSISAVLNGDGLSENPWAHGFSDKPSPFSTAEMDRNGWNFQPPFHHPPVFFGWFTFAKLGIEDDILAPRNHLQSCNFCRVQEGWSLGSPADGGVISAIFDGWQVGTETWHQKSTIWLWLT